ncbi:MAG: hypothetical protein JSV77_06200 [Dehalococcoidales bacterium]|nr:MAG: hypothetical protein JSV77_06200 [Dehalococcoidales bacterium]
MKNSSRLVVAVGIVSLTALLLSGCGISKTEHEALQNEYDILKAELDGIQEVYPPRDFSSISELEDWLSTNDVSEEPLVEYADEWYRKALKIQEDALEDGYIISADYDIWEDGETASVWCVAIVRGRAFFWDPETDDITEETFFGTVK